VVCLVNNYDTRVFAFFIPIHGKIFIFILTTPSYGDEPKNETK
jgi:hypothetical protein